MAVFFLVHPPERIKQIWDIFLFYPLPGILHRIPDEYPVDTLALAADGEGNGALAGVFDCVI